MSWVYLACATLNFDVSVFLLSDKWDGKFSRQKHARWRLSHSCLPQWCQNGTEQHEEPPYQRTGGLGCHRMVTFSAERHYDNEHSFSITSNSRAPFPLKYFSESNGLWQSYLLHCMVGLFLEVTLKKTDTEDIRDNLYQSNFHNVLLGVMGNKLCAESNNVYRCPQTYACLLTLNIHDCFLIDWAMMNLEN